MTKSKVFFWLLIAFIAGIGVASFLPLGLYLITAVFILGGSAAAFGLLRHGRQHLVVAGWLAIVLAAGAFWFLRQSRPTASLAAHVGTRAAFEAVVRDDPVRRSKSQQLVIGEPRSAAKILVVTRPFPEYAYGDRLLVSGRLERPKRFSPDFDYAAFLAKDGIFYTMVFPDITFAGPGAGSRLYDVLFRIKRAFVSALGRAVPEPMNAFLAGITIGERQSFSSELTEKLRATGTSHIVALSGFNITIVADAILRALSWLPISPAAAFWLASGGIVGFTLLTGAAASVVRAAIMGVLVLIARQAGRLYHMQNALALAAAIMLLQNPKILRFDVGFQLSFLATLGLVYGTPFMDQWFDRLKRRLLLIGRDRGLIRPWFGAPAGAGKRSFLRATAISTLAAQFAVLPLLAIHFGGLSLVSPLANLAVLPLIPAAMFAGFSAGGLGMFSDALGRAAGWVAWALARYELAAISFFAALPAARVAIRGLALTIVLGAYAVAAVMFWRSHRRRARLRLFQSRTV
ncbi:MAG: ComEC/Rec2 family competence protein [Candidatus Sungbacteria bacterium]|uniref:ComEC/Rec2 family competence protein n=1 Tax=Candidatus Sungiibacteriota bacterium TaxID=2750080 RepID=A0A932YVD6_9BACT|nr:ComEC/Rec2 family competence protein [Candidatus Sungbacteria bacterium]